MTTFLTLLTDFGTADGYVAEVKAALFGAAPDVRIVDVTHDIAPGDVLAGAYVLGRTWAAFPPGTVHLAIVDPGVGTARRGIATTAAGHGFVGPDNGLLDAALGHADAAVVALRHPTGVAATFHGRDVFAPAAAALVSGAALHSLGRPITDPVRLALAPARRDGGDISGNVVHVDRFGTLVTNLPGGWVAEGAQVRFGAYDLVLRTTFGDVAPGEAVAFVGSSGAVEIAIRDGRADALLGLTRGTPVRATAR